MLTGMSCCWLLYLPVPWCSLQVYIHWLKLTETWHYEVLTLLWSHDRKPSGNSAEEEFTWTLTDTHIHNLDTHSRGNLCLPGIWTGLTLVPAPSRYEVSIVWVTNTQAYRGPCVHLCLYTTPPPKKKTLTHIYTYTFIIHSFIIIVLGFILHITDIQTQQTHFLTRVSFFKWMQASSMYLLSTRQTPIKGFVQVLSELLNTYHYQQRQQLT